MSPYRIVHVTTVPQTLWFFAEHFDYLKKKGFDIKLISSPGEKGIRLSEEKNIDFIPIKMERTISPFLDVASLASLWKHLLRIRPDIVHSHTPKAGLLGTLAARMAGAPIVFLSQFGLPQMTMRGSKRIALDALTRLSCCFADRVWIDSPSMRRYLIERKLCPISKAMTIGGGSVNGVDAVRLFSPDKFSRETIEKDRALLGVPGNSLALGFVGRVAREKGLHELAQTWIKLKMTYKGLHLIILGDGDDRDPILEEDREIFESDPNIHLVGFCDEVPRYMAMMDIFVMPSYREGFGITNIEAAAMRLPVVSTRIPGCVDSVKDGETGLLVPPRDAERLASAIRTYLENPCLRIAHGEAGRKRVLKEYQPGVIWEGLYQEYRAAISKKLMRH